jgi:hypothetical protein
MSQTIKYGKLRAKGDPDRDNVTHGIYIGRNTTSWDRGTPFTSIKNTRGAFVKRGND